MLGSIRRPQGHCLEITVFTAADESLRKAFQTIPTLADSHSLVFGHGVVIGGSGNFVQQIGKLTDDFLSRWQDVGNMVGTHVGIFHEVPILLAAQPLDDAIVTTEVDDLEQPIQWILAPTAEFRRLLRPFINQRERHAQLCRDGLWGGFLQGTLQDFMTFHAENLQVPGRLESVQMTRFLNVHLAGNRVGWRRGI